MLGDRRCPGLQAGNAESRDAAGSAIAVTGILDEHPRGAVMTNVWRPGQGRRDGSPGRSKMRSSRQGSR